jgi:hypothetical protein
MADRPASLRIGRLRVRADSAQAAHDIAAQFGGALSSIPAPSALAADRVTLQAKADSGGRGAARALGAYLGGGRDG